MKLNKLLAIYGDKILLVAFLIYALYVIIVSIADISIDSQSVKDSQKAILNLQKQDNKPPEKQEAKYHDKYKSIKAQWPANEALPRSVFYQDIDVDFGSREVAYNTLLKEHKHESYDKPILIAEKKFIACMFPGCSNMREADETFLGNVEKPALHHASPVALIVKWPVPEHKMLTISHALVMKRKYNKNLADDQDWQLMKDGAGKDLRLQLGGAVDRSQAKKENEKETLENLDPMSIFDDIIFQKGSGESGKATGSAAAADKPSLNTQVPDIENVGAMFVLLDKDIEPGLEYEYKVSVLAVKMRAINEKPAGEVPSGESAPAPATPVVESEIVQTPWSEVLRVKSLGVERVKFKNYLPAIRNVQPERVMLQINNVFTPPWKGNKYIISHQYWLDVKADGSSNVGLKVPRFDLKTEAGHPVLYNEFEHRYLYVGDERNSTQADYDKKASMPNKTWLRVRPDIDFTTPWQALKVREQVDETKSVFKRLNTATAVEEEEVKVQRSYRYFLELKNGSTGETKEIELERENLSQPLRTN